MVKREKYLSQIRDFYDKDIIKIITGIRRSGKSVLLKQIIEELLQLGIDSNHIIYINFFIINRIYSLIISYKIFIINNLRLIYIIF